MPTLEIDQLRAFLVVADLHSFTAAGACLGATQSAVSLRLAKLEERLGRRLLARTPRAVSLTPDGSRLLPHARAILAAHDRAVAEIEGGATRGSLRLAVSDHAAGGRLASALAALRVALPLLAPEVTVGLSGAMLALYDRGEAEAVILRRDGGREGTRLFEDPLIWAGAHADLAAPGEPVPLVALTGPCGVKAAATGALDAAGLPWRYAFLGGSVSALQAALQAGLGVAALGERHLPAGCLRLSEGLPPLPTGEVVLHSRLDGPTQRILAAAFAAPEGLRKAA